MLWATSFSRHGRAGASERLVLIRKNPVFTPLVHNLDPAVRYMPMFETGCVIWFVCGSASVPKVSCTSQYLHEISVWNHERPDPGPVVEPDRVSSDSPQNRRDGLGEKKRQFGSNRYSHQHATAFQHQRQGEGGEREI